MPDELVISLPIDPSISPEDSARLAVDIQGHRAETERLGKLVEFLRDFGPVRGHTVGTGRPVDEGVDADQLVARDRAISDCFLAVGRIARSSFPYSQDGEPACP